jgi:cytochrome oxidase assembly protein ShyY1
VRFLLRPGWLALIAVVIGFVIVCYTLLAPWQFGREAQREAQQQAIDTSYAIAPVPLGELVPAGEGVARDVEWRQVTVTGEYLPGAEAVVRLRVVDGRPAFEALTPFRTTDGRLVAVDRGYVAAASGSIVPDFAPAPPGPVTLTARLRVDETDPQDRAVFDADGHRQLYAADSRQLAAATGLDLERGYLQLAADQPGVLGPLAVVPNTGGAPFTNLSYALQWLTFGAIAIFALAYFVRLELLQRRSGDRSGDRSALRRALSGDDPAPAPEQDAPAPGETPLADRYGRR